MNFNVYLDKRTGEALGRLARKRQTTRNALIRVALGRLVSRESGAEWPEAVMNFTGAPATLPFESHRKRLTPPAANPFA